MNRFQKFLIFLAALVILLFGISQKAVATVQAPVKEVMQRKVEKRTSTEKISLLPNAVIREEDPSENENRILLLQTDRKKLITLEQRRNERIVEEKKEAERLRKKKLAEKRKREEEKRRREIKACIGVSIGSRDRKILERIVEAEAGGETIKGRILVANVVINRVKSKSFPSTVSGVVFSHRGSRYQFSPISDGRYYTVTVSKGTKKAVDMALHGKDPSEGALYFMERSYANSNSVLWFDRALRRLFRYGCHEFFK